jgi:hypothetical protein
VESCFSMFGDSVSVWEKRSTVCDERTMGSDWMHLMVLVGDMAQVEARFGLYGDCANPGARYVHSFCQKYHRHRLDAPDGTPR